ncbi:hypothetical protein D7Y13_22665 [Corallococcus praedator]|uniref:HNH endonuclease n=1 Tax=Corallococcus praedator TaxID=2316724 RepID=A0ABX9QEJ5_9BACT|nr:hypothetical protein D7X75_23830 [Corallococcus sp. CA031C]RKI03209.1 hypothetical protein D7Y13_22665 [Corallococcus praedator]
MGGTVAAKHYQTQKELKREHEKKPNESGCIWKHYIPKGDWQAHPCHYQNNSFKISKGARAAKYTPDAARVEKVRGNQGELKKQYEESLKDHREASEKRLRDLSQERSAAKASGETLPGRVHFRWFVTLRQVEALRKLDPSELLSRYFDAFSDAFKRLAMNDKAWEVGHTLEPRFVNARYLGLAGSLKAQVLGVVAPVGFAPNHDLARLGSWYPYDHEHHHIIPDTSLRNGMLRLPDAQTSFQQRLSVLMESKWNVHNDKNVILLPDDVTIADILGLPAHCPWGSTGHEAYSEQVESSIEKIAAQIDEELAVGEEDAHEAEKKAGLRLKEQLELRSLSLYRQIVNREVTL